MIGRACDVARQVLAQAQTSVFDSVQASTAGDGVLIMCRQGAAAGLLRCRDAWEAFKGEEGLVGRRKGIMLRIFFLVFSQLTIGGLALMSLVPAADIGKGFFRTCASIYLLTLLFVLAGLEWARPWELLGFVLFTLGFLTYMASLWVDRLPDSLKLLKITLGVGCCAVIASALSYSPVASSMWEMTVRALNFLFSVLSLGAAMSGMLLGHWYLVTPELSLAPIKRLTAVLLGALVAQGILLALSMSPQLGMVPAAFVSRVQHLIAAYPYFLLGRISVGLVGTFGLATLTMWLLREGSTQAATGFLYTAVLTVTVGELIARFLFQLTGVPV
jgi:hypothetical protein